MFEPTRNEERMALTSPWMSEADEQTLWTFLDGAPVALIAADDDRRFVRVNSRWCEMTGYTSDAATSMRIDDLLAPESRPGIEMRWGDLTSTGLATARV